MIPLRPRCRPSTEHVNDTTRTATDEICRAARNIIQVTSDVEKYVLKRFPLSAPALDDIDSYASHRPPPIAAQPPRQNLRPNPPPPYRQPSFRDSPRRVSSLRSRPSCLRADLCDSVTALVTASPTADAVAKCEPAAITRALNNSVSLNMLSLEENVRRMASMPALSLPPDHCAEATPSQSSIPMMPQVPARASATSPLPPARLSVTPTASPQAMIDLFSALDRKEVSEEEFLSTIYEASSVRTGGSAQVDDLSHAHLAEAGVPLLPALSSDVNLRLPEEVARTSTAVAPGTKGRQSVSAT
jgi:hypothetical protein